MKRYAVYARVSTEEQSHAGHVSLAAQLSECHRYVSRLDGHIVLSEQDVQSGHQADRSGYTRVKEAARRRDIDAVIVWKLDRFGRNFREWINAIYELEQEIGIAVESVTDSNDPLTRNIMMSVAEQYLRDLSKNTINGLRFRAGKGEWSGAPPIGYRVYREDDVSRLVPDATTAPIMAQVFREAATGRYSLAQLSEMMKGLGLTGRTGHYLSRQALGRILRNPTYRGALVYGRQSNGKFRRRGPRPKDDWIVVEDAHPAIVDAETFDAVQAALSRHREEQGSVRHTKHLLTSLVYCGVCAGTAGPDGQKRAWRMYGHGSIKGRYYECSRRVMYGECSLPGIAAVGFEEAIKAEVERSFIVITEETRREAERYVEAEIEERQTAAENQRRNLLRDLTRHQERREQLALQRLGMADTSIPEDVYQRLESREAEAVAALERTLTTLPDTTEATEVLELMDTLRTVNITDFDAEDWRELLVLLVERIVVRGRGDYVVEWQDSADVLSRSIARASRLGS